MPPLLRALAGVLLVATSLGARAEPLKPERVQELCAGADGPAHCGRLIEAEQLKALPDLAKRDGDTLTVKLFPSGTRLFVDSSAAGQGEKSYAVWDYWSPVNAVVLFVTAGDELSYAVLQRATGQLTVLPAEPVLAPDRQRIVVADFCGNCTNELAVWRVSRDGLRKELVYRPPATWSDVTAAWKDPETLELRYALPGASETRVERKLSAGDWKRP